MGLILSRLSAVKATAGNIKQEATEVILHREWTVHSEGRRLMLERPPPPPQGYSQQGYGQQQQGYQVPPGQGGYGKN